MVEQRVGVAFEDLDHCGRLFEGQPRRAKSVRRPIQVRPRCMRDVPPGRVQHRIAAMSDRLHVQIAAGHHRDRTCNGAGRPGEDHEAGVARACRDAEHQPRDRDRAVFHPESDVADRDS